MEYIKIKENGINIVFGITQKNQIKLLHFSKAEFDKEDLCKFRTGDEAEDLKKSRQFIDESYQLVQIGRAHV